MKPRNEKEAYLAQQTQRLMPQVPPAQVRLRALDVFRADLFKGLLADAILHRLHPGVGGQDASPPAVIAILLSRFSAKAVDLARQDVAAFCPDLNWLIMDTRGRVTYAWQGHIHESNVEALQTSALEAAPAAPRRMFSPNNQWLLKVMLLSGMDSRYWGGPAVAVGSRVSDLARSAGSPQPSVSVFLRIAEEQGWLVRGKSGYVMHGIPQLLEQWSYHLHSNPDRAVPVGSLFPGEGVDDVLGRLRGRAEAVIGGHAGAHALGLGISNFRTPRVYVRDLDAGLQSLSLVAAPPDQAVATLVQPKAVDAVFRAAVAADDKAQIADALQVYLDVRLHPARGEEQADHIYERVLAPFFRKRRWL